MARLGKSSASMPEALLKDWREDGPGMLSSDGGMEDNISRSIGLSMNSKAIAKNVPAHILLATLAMLPAGTTHSGLDRWAPQIGTKKRAAISVLNNVALIVDAEQMDDMEVSISVHPVVRSYMQQCSRIPPTIRDIVRDACYKFILEHQTSPGDSCFKDNIRILSSEELNIQSILLGTTKIHTIMPPVSEIEHALEALVAFCWYQHWTKPRTELIEHGLELSRAAQLDQYTGELLFCLGKAFFSLGRYHDACSNFIEARHYFKRLSDVARASECAFELSWLYIYLLDVPSAENALLMVSEEDRTANGYVGARWMLEMGACLWGSHKFPEALESLNAAKDALESEEMNRPVDAARCLYVTARVLSSMSRLPEALEAMNQSLRVNEMFGPDNRMLESSIGKVYLLLAIEAPFDEILPVLQHTMQRAQEIGRPLWIAQALDHLGELYAREGKLLPAIEYYKAAETEYKTMPHCEDHIARCQDNHRRLSLVKSNPTETGLAVSRLTDCMI